MILFLDIDGVLNTNYYDEVSGCNGICFQRIQNLNDIFTDIGFDSVDIVLSTAWRYLILNGSMTIQGFKYMMQTHGLHSEINIVGFTDRDPPALEDFEHRVEARAQTIAAYVYSHRIENYVIVDDLDLTQFFYIDKLIVTDGHTGLDYVKKTELVNKIRLQTSI